jgi:hypothetical protein
MDAQMLRRIAISICLCLFVSSSSFATGEEAPNFDPKPQTSISIDEKDFASDANHARRLLKRSPRGKSSSKSLPSLNRPPREIALMGWTSEASFAPNFSKSSVYQQINVYRI